MPAAKYFRCTDTRKWHSGTGPETGRPITPTCATLSFRLTSCQPRSLKTLRQVSASFARDNSVTIWRSQHMCQRVSVLVTSGHNNLICSGCYPVRIDSSVGIAMRYGLNGPGIESLWEGGRDIPHPFRPALGAHPASYTMGTGTFLGVKQPRRGVDHPPHIAPRLKKEYSFTSASPPPSVCLCGLFWDELYFTQFHSRQRQQMP